MSLSQIESSALRHTLYLNSNDANVLYDQGMSHFNLAAFENCLLIEHAVVDKQQVMKCIECLDLCIELDPDHCEAYALRGAARLIMEDLHQASLDLEKALTINKHNRNALMLLSAIDFKNTQFVSAIINLRKIIEIFPNDNFVKIFLAKIYFKNQNLDQAEFYISQSSCQNDAEISLRCAIVYEKAQKLFHLLEFEETLILDFDLADKNGVKTLLNYTNEVIAIDSKNANAYVYRGACLLVLGNFQEATNQFNQALELEKENMNALLFLAFLNFKEEKMEIAIMMLKTILKQDPCHCYAKACLTKISLKKGDLKQAALDISTPLKNNFQSLFLRFLNACITAKSDIDTAREIIKDIEDCFDSNANNHPKFVMYSCAKHLLWNNLKTAHEMVNKVLNFFPKNEKLLLIRAEIYFLKKDFSNAIHDLNTILSLNPKNPVVLFFRAILFLIIAYQDGMIEDFNLALKMNQENNFSLFAQLQGVLIAGNFLEVFQDEITTSHVHKNFGGEARDFVCKARICMQLGLVKLASTSFEKALMLDPNIKLEASETEMLKKNK